MKASGNINDVVRIPCTLDGNFFKLWFTIMKPYHGLTDREISVIAAFVKKRHELSKIISDPKTLDRVVMNEDTRKDIREELDLSAQHFHMVMSKLRSSRVIVDGKINPKFIPSVKEGQGNYQMLFLYEFNEDDIQGDNTESGD